MRKQISILVFVVFAALCSLGWQNPTGVYGTNGLTTRNGAHYGVVYVVPDTNTAPLGSVFTLTSTGVYFQAFPTSLTNGFLKAPVLLATQSDNNLGGGTNLALATGSDNNLGSATNFSTNNATASGLVDLGHAQTLSAKTLTTPTINGLKLATGALTRGGATGANSNATWSVGSTSAIAITLTNHLVTFTVSGTPNEGPYTLYMIEDSVGGWTNSSWDSKIKWWGSGPPALNTNAGVTNIFYFWGNAAEGAVLTYKGKGTGNGNFTGPTNFLNGNGDYVQVPLATASDNNMGSGTNFPASLRIPWYTNMTTRLMLTNSANTETNAFAIRIPANTIGSNSLVHITVKVGGDTTSNNKIGRLYIAATNTIQGGGGINIGGSGTQTTTPNFETFYEWWQTNSLTGGVGEPNNNAYFRAGQSTAYVAMTNDCTKDMYLIHTWQNATALTTGFIYSVQIIVYP